MDDLALTKKAERYVSEMSNAFDFGSPATRGYESTSLDMTTTVDTGQQSTPVDLLTLQIDRTSRKALATSIEALIDMLDEISPDVDLEETGDDEPSLGWTLAGRQGETCDLEKDDSDDEPDSEGEPMHGAIERHPTSRESPWGRSGELTVSRYGSNSQEDWAGSRATLPGHDDCEAENEHGGDVLDEPHDSGDDDEYELGWTEHVDQRKAGIVDRNSWNHPEGEPLLGWCENHGKGVMLGEPADDREGDDEREQPDSY